MKKWNRILSLALAAGMTLSLAACGGGTATESKAAVDLPGRQLGRRERQGRRGRHQVQRGLSQHQGERGVSGLSER